MMCPSLRTGHMRMQIVHRLTVIKLVTSKRVNAVRNAKATSPLVARMSEGNISHVKRVRHARHQNFQYARQFGRASNDGGLDLRSPYAQSNEQRPRDDTHSGAGTAVQYRAPARPRVPPRSTRRRRDATRQPGGKYRVKLRPRVWTDDVNGAPVCECKE